MSWLIPQLQTRQTERYGRGVFTPTPITKDSRLALLGGHILTLEQLNQLDDLARDSAFQISDELACTYATLEELSARDLPAAGDYFNHSCAPNAGFRGMLELVAMRDIASDEEITFDYATCLTTNFSDMDCACRAANCRGRITGDDWKLPELQNRLRGYFQPYIEEETRQIQNR